MSNTIKLKSSATPGKVPLASDLASGELAINTADGKLYALVGGIVTSLTIQEWSELTGKPATFTPSEHAHTLSSVDGLQDIITDLTNRIVALEDPGGNPAEDDDMKLIGTYDFTNNAVISITDGFDDTLYCGYHLIINNLAIEDSDYREKQLGFAIWDGSSWQNGYGWITTSVIKTGAADGATQGTYSGLVLARGEMDSIYLSGTMTIATANGGKGSFTANLNSGNGNPYVSAMLSAPIHNEIKGLRFDTDAQTNNVISGSFSIYGLKK